MIVIGDRLVAEPIYGLGDVVGDRRRGRDRFHHLPERIVDEMLEIAEQGYSGAALSFVNYADELPFFCDSVLPLMKQVGLRIE
jgi:alkanesulfonate monooxygenase SsuD/methylene tetrahydromethanopterin reductase-like flavin-dependent oxidoreductase (luciferase family)